MFAASIDTQRGIIFTEAEGCLCYGDMALFLKQLLADPDYSLRFDSILTLHPQADLSEWNAFPASYRSAMWTKYAELRAGTCWALVSSNRGLLDNVARQLCHLPEGLVRVGYFPDRGEAVSWIQQERKKQGLPLAPGAPV